MNFVVVFNIKIWQKTFTRYTGEPVLTGFHIYFWKNCREEKQIIVIVRMSQNISHFENSLKVGKPVRLHTPTVV